MPDMKRREFITLLGGSAVMWPVAARAQQRDRVRRIGVLVVTPETDRESQARIAAFQDGLERTGWTIGGNLLIDRRWGISDLERAHAAIAELLKLGDDVIVANGVPGLRAAQQASRAVPIVFTGVSDPIALGFIESLARPGGNITGFTLLEPTIGSKWLELLKEIAPRVTRVAVLFNPDTAPAVVQFSRSAEAAAQKLAVQLLMSSVREPAEIDAIIMKLGNETGGGLMFPTDTFTTRHRKLIVELTSRYRLPAVFGFRNFADEGGLISYGVDVRYQFGQAAAYVDRILRGEKPADLPVQQPIKFELVINLKTAKTLHLDVPPTLLVAADEVIE